VTVQADYHQLQVDHTASEQALAADRAAIKAAQDKKTADLAPLKATLTANQSAAYAALAADEQACMTTRTADLAQLQADEQAVKGDTQGSAQFNSDRGKYMADAQKMSSDIASLKAARQADITTWSNKLKADHDAIKAQCAIDDPIIQTDCSKLQADRAQWQQTILTDYTKLKTDLAGETSTGGTSTGETGANHSSFRK
jgi:hypothetical protein